MYKLTVYKNHFILLLGLFTFRATRLWTRLLVSGIVAACLLSHADTGHAYGLTQCASTRYGADLGCTAGDVSITNMRVVGDVTSCTGGTTVTIDLELTINFATPNRWDIGVFISNDGKTPQLLPANGGAASCAVSVLPPSSPFLNLDGPTDTCGDGNNGIGGGTGSGIHYMPGVTIACQALAGSGGNLYIPFVVSWDNQSSPSGGLCTSNADPVPNTKSKCNAPTIAQGTVTVVVLPTITNTDGITTISSGGTTNYTVVITNTTGDTLSNIVFKDPAVTNITVNNVNCSFSGGASCPGSTTIAGMQGAGLTIPSMPANSTVTFTINATLTGTPPDTLTNTASVTVGSQTKSASDTDTIVGTIAILPTSLSKSGSQGILMVYNYTLYNFGGSLDNITLSEPSPQVWIWQIWNAAGTIKLADNDPVTPETSTTIRTVASGNSENFIVKVQIPGDAAIGTVDTTTITAISGNDPSKTATATAVTTVSDPLTFTPNNTGAGGKGSSVFYDHRVQNNTATNNLPVTFPSVVLSGSCAGWTAGVYKSDKVSQIPPATVTLAAFGGYEDIVVRVNIPAAGAASGSTCTVTVTTSAGPSATDVTTVKDLVLYSGGSYTDESYIFPTEETVYARAFGLTVGTTYLFRWYYDPGSVLKQQRTKIPSGAPGPVPDYYDIPSTGPLGTWRMEVWNQAGTTIVLGPVYFYVGPDHLNATYTYTGANPGVNSNVTIDLALHGKDHVVPLDPSSGNVVQGNPPTTKDPLKITVTVSGSATITKYCNDPNDPSTCTSIVPTQTVTFNLPASGTLKGTATITITDSARETVTITPASYNSALYGSPARDESTTVTFVRRRMRILDWREVVQ